ncbi:hypothetical protein FVE85_5158 [Porphyridium purpureum]|uniref:Uncharacterized protein n=1 Tax=Porphyridium purpureum TaxID=35688 RepID=A0A5J4Z3P1_PORPP|nr:hypothetical protein FVE85_5158 [Porphyridium purpureum]|eukprot:POR0066..scf295_1
MKRKTIGGTAGGGSSGRKSTESLTFTKHTPTFLQSLEADAKKTSASARATRANADTGGIPTDKTAPSELDGLAREGFNVLDGYSDHEGDNAREEDGSAVLAAIPVKTGKQRIAMPSTTAAASGKMKDNAVTGNTGQRALQMTRTHQANEKGKPRTTSAPAEKKRAVLLSFTVEEDAASSGSSDAE